MDKLKVFLLSAFIFLILDIIWLMFFAKKMYLSELSQMLSMSDGSFAPRMGPAIVVYVIIVIGLTFMVIPASAGSLSIAAMYGAIYGLAAYGVYNFTNLAVLKEWSTQIACLETLYGAVACAATAAVVVFIKRFI